jgi:hypothetical protein
LFLHQLPALFDLALAVSQRFEFDDRALFRKAREGIRGLLTRALVIIFIERRLDFTNLCFDLLVSSLLL